MIEKIAAWCMVVVSLIAGYILIDNHFVRSRAETAQSKSLDGKRLDIPEISWPESPAHLVLAISSHCRFCIAEAPFYKQVTNENLGNTARVVVISSDEPQPLQQFLKANSIRTDNVVLRPLSSIGVKSTPTVLVVDAGGVVRGTFIGQLDSVGKDEVRNLLHRTASRN